MSPVAWEQIKGIGSVDHPFMQALTADVSMNTTKKKHGSKEEKKKEKEKGSLALVLKVTREVLKALKQE